MVNRYYIINSIVGLINLILLLLASLIIPLRALHVQYTYILFIYFALILGYLVICKTVWSDWQTDWLSGTLISTCGSLCDRLQI